MPRFLPVTIRGDSLSLPPRYRQQKQKQRDEERQRRKQPFKVGVYKLESKVGHLEPKRSHSKKKLPSTLSRLNKVNNLFKKKAEHVKGAVISF